MKKLTKKQIVLIVITAVLSLLCIFATVYLTANLINSTLKYINESTDETFRSAMIEVMWLNILFQITLLGTYASYLWLAITVFKQEKVKQLSLHRTEDK